MSKCRVCGGYVGKDNKMCIQIGCQMFLKPLNPKCACGKDSPCEKEYCAFIGKYIEHLEKEIERLSDSDSPASLNDTKESE